MSGPGMHGGYWAIEVLVFQSPDGDSLCPDSKMHHIHGGAKYRLKFASLFCVNLWLSMDFTPSPQPTGIVPICTTLRHFGFTHHIYSIMHFGSGVNCRRRV